MTDGMERAATGRSYDRVAGDYAAAIADELAHKPFDRGLLDALVELAGGGVVADVGSGPGHVAAYLSGRGARVVAADLSPAMCALAHGERGLPACAADLTALPFRTGGLRGLVCLYAVIHLDAGGRAAAYQEMGRVLAAGGHALVAFHTGDADTAAGGRRTLGEWWGHDVALTFHFLDPAAEVAALQAAGLRLEARLDRAPHAGHEHESRRSYLVVTPA